MEAHQRPSPALSRRSVLALIAAAGVTAVGGYGLFEYSPWLNPQDSAVRARRPFGKNLAAQTQMLEIVRYATLAASGHNTQPWKFTVSQDAITIRPDSSRALAIVDAKDREMWISLGGALENLVIAARAAGFSAKIAYPDAGDVIRVALTAETPQGGPLFEAIPLRQSTRSDYDGQPIAASDLGELQAVELEPGITLHFAVGGSALKTVSEFVSKGDVSQYADKAFVGELITWLRFDRREALASLDGLYTRCTGNPEVPRWLGQVIVGSTAPRQQADTDAKKLLTSSGAIVVASASESKNDWVRAGQVFARLALTMTSLGIQTSFMNQPIEIAVVRSQFQSALALGTALPQLLLRFGHGPALPLSQRRPVDRVLG